jgi:hypothetical protein
MENWALDLPNGDTQYPVDFTHPDCLHLCLRCTTAGKPTNNSKFPRCELREMIKGKKARWSSDDNVVHCFSGRYKIKKLPIKKPEICIFQIHDGSNDRLQIIVSGSNLFYKFENRRTLIGPYGEMISILCSVRENMIDLRVNKLLEKLPIKCDTLYFKTGNYMQTNSQIEQSIDVEAEIEILECNVFHF